MAGRVKEILPYMNLYGRDLFTDPKVEAMTTEQVGAHCLLIMRAWYETPGGSIPDDDKTLARWVQAQSVEHWKTFKSGVMTAWELKGDRWFQKRVVKEFRDAVAKQRKAKSAAEQRWNGAPKKRHARAMRSHSGRNATHTVVAMPSEQNRSDQIRSEQSKAAHGESPPPPVSQSDDPVAQILKETGLAMNANGKVKSQIARMVEARGPKTTLREIQLSLEQNIGGADAVEEAANRIFGRRPNRDEVSSAPTSTLNKTRVIRT